MSAFTVLSHLREEAGAQFVRGSCVKREDVRTIAVGLSLHESVLELFPDTSRDRRGPRVIDQVQIGEQILGGPETAHHFGEDVPIDFRQVAFTQFSEPFGRLRTALGEFGEPRDPHVLAVWFARQCNSAYVPDRQNPGAVHALAVYRARQRH